MNSEFRLREATADDDLWSINAAAFDATGPIARDELDGIRARADRVIVATEPGGELAGFAITFAPGSDYGSQHYGWFGDTYGDRFYYLDRIILGAGARRRGLGSLIYDRVSELAAPYGRFCVDIYVDPPNVGSLAFHEAWGFDEVHRHRADSGKMVGLFVRTVR